ncbi:EamA family transporter [soil metagenome]
MSQVAARPSLGYALVVSGASMFILNAGVSRVVMRSGIDPGAFTTIRITGAACVFALLALCFRRSALRPPTGSAIWLIGAYGLIGVAALQLTYNIAINRLPLGIALLIEYLAPVLVILWVRFVRKESVHRRMWGAIVLSLLGLALVAQVGSGVSLDTVGVVAALLAAVSFATYFLLGEHNVGFTDPLRIMLWSFIVAAMVMNVVWPPWHVEGLGDTTTLLGNLDGISLPVWVLVGWVIVMGTVTPFFAQLAALQHLPATVVTVVAMLEPVGATALGWAWFNESLDAYQVVGGLLVIAGIGLAQSARRGQAAAPLPPQ